MADRSTVTEFKDADEVRDQFSDVLDRVALDQAQVVVSREGRRVAAVISIADYERLRREDQRIAEGLALLDEMAKPFTDVAPAEIEREAIRAVADARVKLRAKATRSATDR